MRREDVLNQTLAALWADPDLYSRDDSLVEVVIGSNVVSRRPESVADPIAGSPRVIELDHAIVGCKLT